MARGGYRSLTDKDIKYNQIYGFTYDVFGNRTGVTLQGETKNMENSSLPSSSPVKTLASYSYKDGNGNLEEMVYAPSETPPLAKINYTYDKLDRLSKVTYSNMKRNLS